MYEPQAAYSAFVFRFKHKITYLIRCIPNISYQLEVLDEIILTKLILTISNGVLCSELERKLILLPPKLGGLGIPIFSQSSEFEFGNSITINGSLKQNIKSQIKSIMFQIKKRKKRTLIVFNLYSSTN